MNKLYGMAFISFFFAVLFGAFGAHWIKSQVDIAVYQAYQTGALYHLIHSLALLCFLALGEAMSSRKKIFYNSFMIVFLGILFFSGSLYLYAITSLSWMVHITPIGGLLFLFAWGQLAYFFLMEKKS
ncbi:MAG: DUF423 domain-containing protein [Bdellovibrionales bacterium]|nr:DUF423 domain-containing protein [Bdellovibrionales bacterium]